MIAANANGLLQFFKICKYRAKEVSPIVFNFSRLFYVFPFLQVPTSWDDKEHNLGNSAVEQISK